VGQILTGFCCWFVMDARSDSMEPISEQGARVGNLNKQHFKSLNCNCGILRSGAKGLVQTSTE